MDKQIIRIDKPGKYEYLTSFDKNGEEKKWVGVVRAMEKGEYEVDVLALHKAENTSGRMTVKAIVSNGAQLKLTGLIKILKSAQKTDNFLELRVLILDDLSRATAEPKLEIEANDVKASHAASVGKIDEEQILYMMSRGISREKAKEEIVNGFLAV